MSNPRNRKKLSPSLVGAGVGLVISLAIIIYSYNYAVGADPRITGYWHYLFQKQYRLIQLLVQLFPIVIGFFWGRELEEKRRLQIVANENRFLYQETLEKQTALDRLMYRISQAHEEERRRISRELHDGIAQNLSGIILNLRYLREHVEEESSANQLGELEGLVKETIVDLRRIISDLKPVTLDSLGLTPTLEKLTKHYEKEHDLKVDLSINLEKRLTAALEISIFRIIQEALNNAAKHAAAANARVSIEKSNGAVEVIVEDDGAGFNYKDAERREKGFGLIGMRERTESFGGTVDIDSRPGAGTKITATFPLFVPAATDNG